MNVAVLGLWHLGSVTAACLAGAGHSVKAFDPDPATVDALAGGRPPVAEPGLPELIARGLQSGHLEFTKDLPRAVKTADIVWIAFDTPVDEEDRADRGYVEKQARAIFPHLADRAVVLLSSQLPVGTVRKLEDAWAKVADGRTVSFACSPENLRLGNAIEVFTMPDRVVVGVRNDHARQRVGALLEPITARIEWMSIESAEMTKHAVNAFLATSVTLANELAALCELAGADARQVERGLRTERRIGPYAYVSPGSAFAGGTLARDVEFLRALGNELELPTPLLDGVVASNAQHSLWARRRLESDVGSLAGRKIAIWGLTYKPGTDTIRRSSSIELCRWLVGRGARVHVHDPAATGLPEDLPVTRHQDPLDAATEAHALVVATDWPLYRQVDVDRLATLAPDLLVLDANRFLGATLGSDSRFRVVAVGQPSV
ncbi:MAG TPA: nucleotide sugar dehydrogenase [Vicinamibacterales bacterium]|jgi:UDPglucose 6-dehydrogenase